MERWSDVAIHGTEGNGPDPVGKAKKRMIAFTLNGESYCVDIKEVKEVIKPSLVTKIPNAPEFIVGVVNLRGEILTIIDIRRFLNLEARELTEGSRIIITEKEGEMVGILVDGLSEALEIEDETVQPPLAVMKGRQAEYIIGQVEYDGELLVLLDLTRILSCEEIVGLNCG